MIKRPTGFGRVSFTQAQTLLVCVGGDKAAWARRKSSDWYDVFVPIADAVTDLYLQEHP